MSEINFQSGDCLFGEEKQSYSLTFFSVIVLLLYITFFYFFAFMPIDGKSMENTIYDKQYCLVQRRCFSVERGDIITVNTAENGEEDHILIKRIIGISGDKLVFMESSDGNYVDIYLCKAGETIFTKLDERYIKEKMLRSAPVYGKVKILGYTTELIFLNSSDSNNGSIKNYIITVPKDSIYFLGDNRNSSSDSRSYGSRTTDHITSKIISILY